MKLVKVAVLASDPITKAGAASLLGTRAELQVLPEDSAAQADVVLVMEEHVTDRVLARVKELGRESEHLAGPDLVIVADHFRESDLMTAIECGIVAILPRRETGGAELVAAVLAAGDGTATLPPRLQGALLGQVQRMRRDVLEPNGLTLSGLAARECDVLRLVAEGFGTEEIAAKLCYSERTVKNVLYGLMTRCGLNNRAHAVAYALRAGAI
ncbi:MAG TPA: LuxR C-terminal-related transcriptional regulator [Amycolatopsis sp.]|uniref:DNA-binding response regulator, NarL/FixJ family, contains REC and HTH domains n=1 Tax=Amycolatopsis saalfeldensis TaxID=394193 RepID=A0A1H8RAC9_9PSEU|nr:MULTISPECIES: LuxR C-terminal-related transcriptional regulator [Amycolatopsis]SEO63108.1 DNA-binding response regulator, NarL/FixJ family, contains REC and HTH domains [Amycolatopsis saalfeldensis]